MTRGIDAFLEFLKAEQTRGVTHVTLDADARTALRELHRRLKNPGDNPRKPRAEPSPTPTASRPAPPATRQPAAREAPPAPVVHTPTPGSGDPAAQIAALRAQAENWPPASQLGTLRETLVFSTGDPTAKLVLIGEAPGYEEEKRREPFTGPAGKKLDDILKAMGLSREVVYLTNLVKNRPAMARQATNGRHPTPAEIQAWLPFLKAELAVIRPACIVALGSAATEGLLGTDKDITAMRGSWHEFEGIPVRPTYHPSYLLRTESRLGPKRELWEDMLAVMERLGLPIQEKQRGYFLPRSGA